MRRASSYRGARATTICCAALVWAASGAIAGALRDRIGQPEILRDIVPGPDSSFVRGIWFTDDFVLFRHSTVASSIGQLWRTDGTPDGTYALPIDGAYGPVSVASGQGSIPGSVVAGAYVLSLSDYEPGCSTARRDLWFTDGSAAGTVRLGGNACNGSGLPYSTRLRETLDNDRLVMALDRELWAASPKPGSLERILETGYIQDLFLVGGNALAVTPGENGVSELWLTDGTRDGTSAVAHGFAGFELYGSTAREAYFVLNDTGPRSAGDLWVSDGTPLGTRRTGARVPAGVVALGLAGPKLILMDCNSLFVTDTEHDAVAYREIPGCSLEPLALDLRGRALYFVREQGPSPRSAALWSTDGTNEGTIILSPPFVSPLFPYFGVGASFLLLGHPDFGGTWVTDGTAAGSGLLASCGGGECSFTNPLHPLGDGRFAFTMFTAEHGSEPWISDGTSDGTRLLIDLCPGPCSSRAAARRWPGPNLMVLDGYPLGYPSDEDPFPKQQSFLMDESTGELEPLPEIPDYSNSDSRLTAYLANDLVYLAHSPATGFELHRIHIASPSVRGRAGLPRSRP